MIICQFEVEVLLLTFLHDQIQIDYVMTMIDGVNCESDYTISGHGSKRCSFVKSELQRSPCNSSAITSI
jgi:hypothetical protein